VRTGKEESIGSERVGTDRSGRTGTGQRGSVAEWQTVRQAAHGQKKGERNSGRTERHPV
jgi:hypothetical protein